MEQRASTLQARLEARRNMFLKSEQLQDGTNAANPTYGSARSSAPNAAPPQPPPRNFLNSNNSNSTPANGDVESNKKYSTEKIAASVQKSAPEVVKAKPAKAVKQLDGYVGFANLPNQVYRKAVKKGFEFTLMVVGESGLGKSTLINSMFLSDVYSAEYPGPSHRLQKTVAIETNKVLLKESGVNLTLTIVDTPGFGDAVDNSNCWDPVISFVETQYESFLDAETRVNRLQLPDARVHACLYFIAPSGHGLKPLDVEFMKRLHDKVNVIPVLAKADTMTPEEVSHFKCQIMNQIVQAKIRIYEFPEEEMANGVSSAADEADRRENRKMKDRVPFAVVGSNCLIESTESGGKKVRGRKYPWGIVDIENLEHCDFVPLRNMLIRTHLQDLKEVTNNVHYENFRCRILAGAAGGTMEKIPNKNPLAQIEEERREHHNKVLKMEKEMEEVFERKVREKKQKLYDSEADLEKRHKESNDKLEQQKKELDARMAALEQEKAAWEQLNGISVEELKRQTQSMESLDGGKKKKSGTLSGLSFRF
jgi:septin 7